MLLRLHIQNFALMDKLTIEFSGAMNVLTGETGAGKSILIDALRFALGEKADAEKMRSEERACLIEAAFEVDEKVRGASPLLDPYLEEEPILIFRREIQPGGKSRAWINDHLVTASTLRQIGARLVDIHGQYDHQLLLEPESQLEILDQFSSAGQVLSDYQAFFDQHQSLVARRDELSSLEKGREREIDLLRYQIAELERAQLGDENEEGELKTERIKLANAEKFHAKIARILSQLEEGEASASSLISFAYKDLHDIVKLDVSLQSTLSEYESAQAGFEQVLRSLRDYQETLSFDEGRLREVDERLDVLDLIKRKYGGSIAAACEFLRQAKTKYDQLLNSGIYEKEIEISLGRLVPKLNKAADELNGLRKKGAARLKKEVENELKDLGIANAHFECSFAPSGFTSHGNQKIEFQVQLNAGSPLLPLKKIISAGEVSRMMLAMKKALMQVDPIPTLIFDEIDANIGGRLGSVTGKKLKEIAAERQVLLITHLPQIASFGDRHFKVAKVVRQGKTFTEYRVIEGEERVRELAQMMSGQDETRISKEHAKEMLSRGSR